MKFRAMLNGDGRQMEVGRQFTGHSSRDGKALEEIEMSRSRLEDVRLRLIEPRPDLGQGFSSGQRSCEDAAAGHDPQIAKDDQPWQAYGLDAGHRAFPPLSRRLVIRRIGVVGVDQKIDVGNEHRSPIPDHHDTGVIDLHLVDELVQLAEVDSGLESARFGPDSEASGPRARRRARSETAFQGVVHHILETAARTARFVAKLPGYVVVERQRRPHGDIMMPGAMSVKMPLL